MAATTEQGPPVVVAPDLDVGTRLGDRYRLVERLGRGGGGAVWRAFDEKVGEDVALKVIGDGADLERWRREVALARRISHPNVCRVYDLGEAGGRRWVTMERIEGESLRALLGRGAVPDRTALMHQLVDAVAAIHAAGVVHRDLKPENIVVDRSGRAVVVDFGLARLPESVETTSDDGTRSPGGSAVTRHGTVLGTPRYMAPEQAAGQVADARSDVFALGLVLHEIATCGEAAAGDGADAMATTVSDGGETPAPVRAMAALPRPWGPIVARCVGRDPAGRFPDAVAVKAALAPPRARTPRALVAVGAIALAAGVALVVVVARGRDGGGARHEPGEVAVRRLTSTSAQPDTQPLSVALSGDGQTIAYTVGAALFTRPVDGGVATPLAMPTTPGGFAVARLAFAVGFASSGSVLVQVLERDDVWSVWDIGGAGGARRVHEGTRRMSVAVSPDGNFLAIASMGDGLVVRPIAGGAARVVVPARPGENIGGPSWSPDGARVAFVRYAPDWSGDTLEVVDIVPGGATRVLVRGAFANPVDQLTAWPSADRIIYGLNGPDAGALMMVKLAGGAPIELERWTGEYVGLGSWNAGRLAFLRGTGSYAIEVGTVDRRGYVLNLERAHAEGVQARRLVGWTDEGQLVHGEGGDIVMRRPRGEAVVVAGAAADDDIPDTIADGAVLFHHAGAPASHAVWRAKVGEKARMLDLVPTEPASSNIVRCAGDRAPPCILETVADSTVRYERFDPVTGERGVVVHSMPLTGRYMRSFAVSPDGTRMALVDGSNQLVKVDLRDGTIAREALDKSAELQSVTWSRAGDSVIVTMLGGGDELFNVVRVSTTGERQQLLHSNRRWFWRVHESPVDSRVAVQTRELALDIWLLDVVK